MNFYYLFGSLVLVVLTLAIVFFSFLHQKKVFIFRARLHEEELRAQQAVFNALQEGQEKERTRLAEELHDGISARLSGLKMSLEYLISATPSGTGLLEKVYNGVSETLEEVRTLSHDLQPYFFDSKDLEQLLLDYMEHLSIMNGCKYSLSMYLNRKTVEGPLKLHCYRIVAELLNNVHKHAKASLAFVHITAEDSGIEIVVEDNGVGLPTERRNTEGIGMNNIKNRIKVCGGTFSLETSPKGTTVIINLPGAFAAC